MSSSETEIEIPSRPQSSLSNPSKDLEGILSHPTPDRRAKQESLGAELDALIGTCPPSQSETFRSEMRGFTKLFHRFVDKSSTSSEVQWEKIVLPTPALIKPHDSLPEPPDDRKAMSELLSKLVVMKLNGGLGTTMGCKGPKSGIEI